jgi:eukaryotic-like serine/threonine-protein kinase
MECPKCHTSNPPTATRCSKCATPFDFDEGATLAAVNADVKPATPAQTPDSDATLDVRPVDADATLDVRPGTTPTGDVGKGWSVAAATPATGSLAASGTSLAPGTLLGARYEITQLLGQGGMGAVYKARDREVDRFVALKVIKPQLAVDPEILARFKQELILARQVTHKNVIRIFDLGEADGIKFITMEFIDGQDLKSLITEKGKLTNEEIVQVMEQVCFALDAAHGEGVVHRDLKPPNIMIDKSGRVAVMDFGIARSTEAVGGMTQTGALLGTPEYMSPEQVMGEHVDARSDLFTFGVILFQLLIGAMPYKADTVQSAMFKRTRERPKAPIEVDPAVPKMLSDITVKCLELDVNLRYQSALQILTDLEIWKGGGTKVFPISAQVPLDVPKKKRLIFGISAAAFFSGIGAALLLLVVALGYSFRGRIFSGTASPAAPATSLAIMPFRNASGDGSLDWLGSSMAEMLSTDVGQSAKLRMVSSERVGQILRDLRITPETTLDAPTIQRVAEFSNADIVVSGQYAKFGDQIRIDVTVQDVKHGHSAKLKSDAASEKDILATVDRLAADIRQNLDLSTSAVKELQAKSFKPTSTSLPALRDYNEGLQLEYEGKNLDAVQKLQNSTKEDPEFALAYSQLARAYKDLGQDNEAEQNSRKAVELSDKLPDQEKYLIAARNDEILNNYPKAIEAYQNIVKLAPDNADVLFDLGRLQESAGSFDKARETFNRVLTLDPKRVDGLLAMGRVEIEAGNAQSGLDFLNRAQSMAIELGNDEEKAQILQAIGIAYSVLNKPADALKNFQDSLDIKRRLGLKKGIADSLEMSGQMEALLGKNDLALKNLNDALQMRRDIGDKSGEGDVLTDLARFYNDHSQFDQALKLLKQGLQIEVDVGNENNQAVALNDIGNTYLLKGDYEDAQTYFSQALSLREKLNVPTDIADTLHNLAETSMMLGQYDHAVEQYLRALDLRRNANDTRGAAIESASMGILFGYQGRFGAALSAEEDALKTMRSVKETGYWLAEVLIDHGSALAQIGRGDDARKSLDEGLGIARDTNNASQVARALDEQGDSFFYQGAYKSAAASYQQALQSASKTTDRHLTLLSKVNLAKVGLKQGGAASAANTLHGLSDEADSIGLKYLSVQCSLFLAEALNETKSYAKAKTELDRALNRSEKLGLRALLAQSQYLYGRNLQLSGDAAGAKSHFDTAASILGEIQKEAKTDTILKRSDLSPITQAAGK